MGKRYTAILKHLKVPFMGIDVHDGPVDYEKFDRFIIATPTSTHFRFVLELDKFKKPILCEKPLSNVFHEFSGILQCESPLTMTMQYRYFDRSAGDGPSWYNFYNHGKDGLVWDCFQIIALAKSTVDIKETSPVWSCGLNGETVDLREMDKAYVWAVKEWLDGFTMSKPDLMAWHQKVRKFEEQCKITKPSQ